MTILSISGQEIFCRFLNESAPMHMCISATTRRGTDFDALSVHAMDDAQATDHQGNCSCATITYCQLSGI